LNAEVTNFYKNNKITRIRQLCSLEASYKLQGRPKFQLEFFGYKNGVVFSARPNSGVNYFSISRMFQEKSFCSWNY